MRLLFGFAQIMLLGGVLIAQGESENMLSDSSSHSMGELLPLKRIVLFSSGVGYFERVGHVRGNASIELSFSPSQINDILKSMVVQDLDGGFVRSITYSSDIPLKKSLESFSVDLSDNPGLKDILDRIRGEKIVVAYEGSGKIIRKTGRVIGVESCKEPGKENAIVRYFLNLWIDDAITGIDLGDILEVKFENPNLEREFGDALNLISRENKKDKKRVVINFSGEGRRRVRVSYLIEMPLWKTSYRIVVGDNDRHFLQGWAIVENTTDEDWDNVWVSLISGKPISFRMNLYKPYYISRPYVELDIERQTKSELYESAIESSGGYEEAEKGMSKRAFRFRETGAVPPSMVPHDEKSEIFESKIDLEKGVKSAAETASKGEFFEYRIEVPVTIKRGESAMVPIVNTNIKGERVSIYNEATNEVHPLNGIELENNTGLFLSGGPITVFEEGIYAGDSRIQTLAPKEKRFISYSVDLTTEVKAERKTEPETFVSVKFTHGNMITETKRIKKTVYTVRNNSRKEKNLLVEHPLSFSWKLVSPVDVYEKTRNYYRFRIEVPSLDSERKGIERVEVVEERILSRSIVLSNLSSRAVEVYINSPNIDEKIKKALKHIVSMKEEIASIDSHVKKLKAEYSRIRRDQERIRKNMSGLSMNSSLYKRYVGILSEQEDSIEKILNEMENLGIEREKLEKKLSSYILSLNIE